MEPFALFASGTMYDALVKVLSSNFRWALVSNRSGIDRSCETLVLDRVDRKNGIPKPNSNVRNTKNKTSITIADLAGRCIND